MNVAAWEADLSANLVGQCTPLHGFVGLALWGDALKGVVERKLHVAARKERQRRRVSRSCCDSTVTRPGLRRDGRHGAQVQQIEDVDAHLRLLCAEHPESL